jgi:hypothetical protein
VTDKPGRKRWCVHWRERLAGSAEREGWCACRRGLGGYDAERGGTSVETKCGHFVILPGRFEMRTPTCAGCK